MNDWKMKSANVCDDHPCDDYLPHATVVDAPTAIAHVEENGWVIVVEVAQQHAYPAQSRPLLPRREVALVDIPCH